MSRCDIPRKAAELFEEHSKVLQQSTKHLIADGEKYMKALDAFLNNPYAKEIPKRPHDASKAYMGKVIQAMGPRNILTAEGWENLCNEDPKIKNPRIEEEEFLADISNTTINEEYDLILIPQKLMDNSVSLKWFIESHNKNTDEPNFMLDHKNDIGQVMNWEELFTHLPRLNHKIYKNNWKLFHKNGAALNGNNASRWETLIKNKKDHIPQLLEVLIWLYAKRHLRGFKPGSSEEDFYYMTATPLRENQGPKEKFACIQVDYSGQITISFKRSGETEVGTRLCICRDVY